MKLNFTNNGFKLLKCLFAFFLFIFLALLTKEHSFHQIDSVTSFQDTVMTVPYRILIGNSLSNKDKVIIQAIINSTFEEIDTIFNKWNPLSEVSKLNRLKAYEKAVLSPSLFQFLKRINTLTILSEGRFDPTIEPLQKLWKSKLEVHQLPSPQEIQSIQASIGWDKIHFQDGVFFKENSQTELDFGGVAKGWAVDLLIDRLNQAGFSNLYVEWGGDIRATGQHPQKRPWNIYISRLADTNPLHAITFLSLQDQAIATSGDYFQYWTLLHQGKIETYCHIFNPLTLYPLKVQSGSIASASLMTQDCLTADALAKVIMLFESKEEAESWIHKIEAQFPIFGYWMIVHE
jgi:thiamine biosynthesis lipoprotein